MMSIGFILICIAVMINSFNLITHSNIINKLEKEIKELKNKKS